MIVIVQVKKDDYSLIYSLGFFNCHFKSSFICTVFTLTYLLVFFVCVFRSETEVNAKMDQFHFSVLSLSKLGNWLPTLLREWECVDHNCGYDQVLFQAGSN